MPYVKYAKNRIWPGDVLCALYLLREEAFEGIGLSSHERSVAHRMLEGESNLRIAKRLYLSKPGVQYHINGIYDKSGRRSREEFASMVRCRVERSEKSWECAADLRKEGRRAIEDVATKVRYGLVAL